MTDRVRSVNTRDPFPAIPRPVEITPEDITNLDSFTVRGNIRSVQWDGGGSLLSGADAGASAGYLIDSKAGAAQFQQIYAFGGSFTDVSIEGDFKSSNWDGADPANLSSVDATATVGIYIDSSVGAAQFMGKLFVGSNIELTGSGLIATGPNTGPRIEIDAYVSPDPSRIFFRTADVDEAGAANMYAGITGTGATKRSVLSIVGGGLDNDGAGAQYAPKIQLYSDTNDGTTGGVIILGSSSGTPVNEMSVLIENADLTVSGSVEVKDGSDAAPGIFFDGAIVSGLYRIAASQDFGATVNGTHSVRFAAQGVRLNDGSSASPSVFFTGATGTGLYRISGTQDMGIAVNGTAAVRYRSGGVLLQSGNAPAPSLAFVSSLGLGLYRVADNSLGVAAAGSAVANFTSSGLTFVTAAGAANLQIRFTNTSYAIYQDNTGAGSANSRLWFDSPDQGEFVFGPRSGSSFLHQIRYRAGTHSFEASGQTSGKFIAGGSSSSLQLWDGLTDVGDHETLRLNRGTGTGLQSVGYYSSWEFDPLTGRRAKRNFTELQRSPKWKREWFEQLRPVTFIRTSTKQREFGFRIEDFQAINDNLKYLTTKGDSWGFSLNEFGLLAVTIDYVQYLAQRISALEKAAA